MRISEIRIKNFRSLFDVVIPIDPKCTVIVGENNAGKSAVLDTLRLALAQRGNRRLSIEDYDFHLADSKQDPQKSAPIVIDVEFREALPDEWPNNLVSDLNEVIQTNPTTNIDYIYFRTTSEYSRTTKAYETSSQFLNATRIPYTTGRAATVGYLSNFAKYAVVFYLSALRSAIEEFSSRSQFWGQLLRAIDIPDQKRNEAETQIEKLNEELLKLDPNLTKVISTLERIENVIVQGVSHSVSIRALPIRIGDLLARSEIAVQGRGSDVKFPLTRHGQGMQSLSVLFLFQAFVENLLATVYKKETEAILALEEPEAHLHPQAVRALWNEISALSTQSIVSTHSPYLVQNAPLRSIRLLRKLGNKTVVVSLAETFSAALRKNGLLEAFLTKHAPKYSYSDVAGELTVVGRVEESEYRELLQCYIDPQDKEMHQLLALLRTNSERFIDDSDLDALQTSAQRIRGEIFFSRAWLLCEGQTEYVLLHYFAEILGMPLDARNISVIDYQNNGSPGRFAALARAFGFPWYMICDHDQGGKDHLSAVQGRGFSRAEMEKRVHQHPDVDMEAFLIAQGFRNEMSAIASRYAKEDFAKMPQNAESDARIATALRNHKGEWPLKLVQELRRQNCSATRVPELLKRLLTATVGEANG